MASEPGVLAASLVAVDDARAIMGEASLAQYKLHRLTRLAVERCIKIISEASRRVPEHQARRREVPRQSIARIGNHLRHEYHRVDDEIIWATVIQRFDVLEAAIVAVAESESLSETVDALRRSAEAERTAAPPRA